MGWLKQFVLEILCGGQRDECISLGLADLTSGKGTREAQSMWPRPQQPREHVAHPENASGPFYSENDGCITCGAPNAEAPELVGWHDEPCGTTLYRHCIFRRQPETPEEIEHAIRSMSVSCVENLRYRGTDPVILGRLRDMGMGHLCDALERR